MTQPSLNKTFDTSLIDLNPSFSTTDSGDTVADTPAAAPPPTESVSTSKAVDITAAKGSVKGGAKAKEVQNISTQDAYNQWASVYDTDGNMLQAIDDDELYTLLPFFLGQVSTTTTAAAAAAASTPLSILDLGCGTGRNTLRLLSYPWPTGTRVRIYGVDFSQPMLDIARGKLDNALHASVDALRHRGVDVQFTLECTNSFPIPPSSTILPHSMNAVISTLVLEHIPLPAFFTTLAGVLVPGGWALVTNMHADMGALSQAGFVNEQGVKVRGDSWAYSVDEVVATAEGSGFEVVSVRKRGVREEDVRSGVVGGRGRKWIGVNVWFGVVLKKKGGGV
ncbi:hypothetical protein NX059_011044 [Plenodomus lindquistii]|nr:hypothetical protein NX059_011044 [Plenodomus lindquistii]